MREAVRPGAHHSDRAGKSFDKERISHNRVKPTSQRCRPLLCQIIKWHVTKFLSVEAVEVAHG